MYEPFEAVTSDLSKPTTTVTQRNTIAGPCMCIRYEHEIVVISKEQAMKFFGLVDPNDIGASDFDDFHIPD